MAANFLHLTKLSCACTCRHADGVAHVCVRMIHVGHARVVAEITAALVDAGGLALVCEAKAAMVALGEQTAGCPCYELVKSVCSYECPLSV